MPDEAARAPRRGSGSDKRQRAKIVPVRCSETEQAELARRANAAGLSVAAYVRKQTLDTPAPRMRPRPTVETETLARALGQIGKLGGNLNQIAARMNIDPAVSALDVIKVKGMARELGEVRDQVMKALGRAP